MKLRLITLGLHACSFVLIAAPWGAWLDAPSETEAAAAVAADLQDALATAQEERPDLWDEASRQRARLAAELIASGRAAQ